MDIWLVSKNTSMSFEDNTIQLLGLILLFCFVLFATYLTSRFVGQIKLGQLKDKNFKVIESYKVAPNKFLQLIKMGNRYIVISINKDDIRFITELPEEDVVLPVDGSDQQKMKFSDLFAKVQGKHINTKDADNMKDEKMN